MTPRQRRDRRLLDLEILVLGLCETLGIDPESLRLDREVKEAGKD